MSSERLKRLAEVWRQQGAGGLARWIGYRLAKRLINAGVARVLWLDHVPFDASGTAERDFVFRFATAEELRRWAANADNHLKPAMADRLQSGRDFCLAALTTDRALDAGRLVGYVWFALQWIEPQHSAEAGISFPVDVAYLYRGYVHPDVRGRGLYGALIRKGLDALAGRGVRRLLCLVEWANSPALRSCQRSGWTDLGRLITFGYGPCRAVFGPRAAAESRGITFGCRAPVTVLYSPLSQRPLSPRKPTLESRP